MTTNRCCEDFGRFWQAWWEICGDALDGKEAIARAIELRPDVIVMDLVMPRMDGLSAAEAIRKVLPNSADRAAHALRNSRSRSESQQAWNP